MRRLLGIFVFAVMVAMSSIAHSASFEIVDNAIFIDGMIDDGDAEVFSKLLKANPKTDIVAISSPGGIVFDGLSISEMIYNSGIRTYIPKGSNCDSICSIIFLSGVQQAVHSGQKIGVHFPSIERDDGYRDVHDLSSGEVSWWLGRIGVPIEVVQLMMVTNPINISYLDANELNSFGMRVIILE